MYTTIHHHRSAWPQSDNSKKNGYGRRKEGCGPAERGARAAIGGCAAPGLELAAAGASYSASMSEQPGSDPFGDFQRWLMKAGARSITRDVTDRVKSTMGGGKAKAHADVWDEATTTDPTDEPPECQWCPICRAARRARDSGGSSAGFGDQIAGAADALAGLTRDAFSLFENAMRSAPTAPARSAGTPTAKPPTATPPTATPPTGTSSTATWSTATSPTATPPAATPPTATPPTATPAPPATPAPTASTATPPAAPTPPTPRPWEGSDDGTVVGPGVGWPTVVHPKHEDDEAPHEGGDPGDGGPDGGTDQQVEGSAE
jgi:hypothetical protein